MDVNIQTQPNLRERLARSTRSDHDQIEQLMALDRPDFSVDNYFEHLVRFRRFYRDFESHLESSGTSAALFYSGGRRKLGLIDLDLNEVESLPQSMKPKTDFASLLPTEAHLWGAIYVIEGSTLGGQFLTRKFEKTFGDAVRNRTHFFNSYGSQVGKCWQETVRTINQLQLSENETENAIEGARRTFAAMGRYFAS